WKENLPGLKLRSFLHEAAQEIQIAHGCQVLESHQRRWNGRNFGELDAGHLPGQIFNRQYRGVLSFISFDNTRVVL
ncbi:hypothetical protein CSUI_006024, partial [Cystoisospora suis]